MAHQLQRRAVSDDRLELSARGGGVRLPLHVRPRASRSAIVGVKEGALVVAVRAAPVEGAANDELVRLLAEAFGVRRGDVSVVAGATGRRKLVEVAGLSLNEARQRVAPWGGAA
jgi:uncharacterized protein (TIGR00251 family)